jgi:hypothetical protein
MSRFLTAFDELPWMIPTGVTSTLRPIYLFDQGVQLGLQVAVARSEGRPKADDIRTVWRRRVDGAGFPLLLVAIYDKGGVEVAAVCGPVGDDPKLTFDGRVDQIERICAAALRRPDRASAIRFLATAEMEEQAALPGIRNVGLFATHELANGVPLRSDWTAACDSARALFSSSGRGLITALGYEIDDRGPDTAILRADGTHQAVAVFLEEAEAFDAPAARLHTVSPVAHALATADREGVDWVLLVRGSTIRLHPAKPDVGVGRRGRSATYLEANLDLLPHDEAGYLPLIFSAEALAAGSTAGILEASNLFVTDLGGRLRDRVYFHAVPTLATAIARQSADLDPEGLRSAYGRTMTVLFRLLFVAYAEDKELLPYRTDGAYADRSLTTIARELTDRRLDGDTEHEDFDGSSTELWRRVSELWTAIEKGEPSWHVPTYGGTLFSSDPDVNPDGAALADIDLSDAEFGPTLSALLVDRSSDGLVGPVDFRSLSVREFGTIYEGLLESELSVAQQDLTETKKGLVPASGGAEIAVAEGEVYFHNRSGARKSTGSYFTKPFAVEHLLRHALAPAIDDHLERVGALVEAGDEAGAATALFDFRIADIAMGSGHFLVAAVDHLEARFSRFLTEHPISPVGRELAALQTAAENLLGDLAERYRIDTTQVLRRLIARRCVYGCDLNPVSVELARLAIWIHTFVPGLPLSFLDHNLVVGNSLTGVGTLDEVSDFVEGGLAKAHIDAQIDAARPHLARIAALSDARIEDVEAAREAADAAREALQPARRLLDMLVLARAGLADMDPMLLTDEEMVARRHRAPEAQGYIEALEPLHFPITFPEVFLRDRPGFDCILGNPPWEEVVVEELAFWNTRFPGLKALSNVEQADLLDQYRQERPELVGQFETAQSEATVLRQLLGCGAFPGMGVGDPDLYKAFCWRFWMLCSWTGTIGVVLPRSVFTTKGSADWRLETLPAARTDIVFTKNRNEWLFEDVNPGWPIALVSISPSEEPGSITIRGTIESLAEYRSAMQIDPVELLVDDLLRVDDLLCVPSVDGDRGLELFALLLPNTTFGNGDRTDWRARPVRELDATNDAEQFFTGVESDWPIYNHRNIGHFSFDETEGAFNHTDFDDAIRRLQDKRERTWGRARSPFSEMSRDWAMDPSTLPALHPRIAIRDVVHSSNPRKVWAALVPANTILTNTAPFLIFSRGGVQDQAYVLGLLNSSVVDWFGHTRIGLHLNYFILNALPVPIRQGDDRCNRLVEIAAGLATTNDNRTRFDNWLDLADPTTGDERAPEIAELDAIVSLLFGLPDDAVESIWDRPTRPEPDLVRDYRQKWK